MASELLPLVTQQWALITANKLPSLAAVFVLYLVAKVCLKMPLAGLKELPHNRIIQILYAVLLSPTRHIPGALLDKTFPIRIGLSILMRNKMNFATNQHRKYGTEKISCLNLLPDS